MKHFSFSVLLFLCCITGLKGQNADNRLAELITNSEWFALDAEYPLLKDSVQNEHMKVMSEALLAHYFNKPAEAIELMRTLVNNYQGVLDNDATWAFIYAAFLDYERCQDYATAAAKAKSLIEQIKHIDASADCSSFEDAYRKYTALSSYGATVVERQQPNKNSVISLTDVYADGHFSGYSVPVTHQGQTYRFLCSGAPITRLSKKMAEDLGAVNVGYGDFVYMDSLHVGNITFRNVIATAKDEAEDGQNGGAGAVLGLDLLQKLGEIHIDNVRKEMIFPATLSPMPALGHNLCNDDGYSLQLKVDGKPVALNDILKANMDAVRNLNRIVINFTDCFYVGM